MFEEKKVIHTKRLFMRKPLIEDVEQFYSIIKEDAVGKWLAKSKWNVKGRSKRLCYTTNITLGTV